MQAKISPGLLRNPLHLLSLGFGSGLSPFAPGTCGTLVAIPLYLLLTQLSLWYYLVAVAVAFAIGVYLCGYTSKALGEHDHGGRPPQPSPPPQPEIPESSGGNCCRDK